MSSGPKSPEIDQAKVTREQTAANERAQRGSVVDQSNPFGSISYQTSRDPTTGGVVYKANTQYSPQQKALLDNLMGYRQDLGQTGNQLFDAIKGNYTSAPDFGTGAASRVNQRLDQYTKYLNPQFDYQTSQLDAKLRTQGIMPGTPAYKQQMMDLHDNQSRAVTGFIASAQPQAFQQEVQSYQLPLQTVASMMGASGPEALKFEDTSAAKINPVDVSKGYDLELRATQMAQQQAAARNAAIASAVGTVAGGVMGGPMGASIGSSLAGSLFGGSPGNMIASSPGTAANGGWGTNTYRAT